MSLCEMPLWKHIYHMLHSLDQWYINPRVYIQPSFHEKDLNNLDVQSNRRLNRMDIQLGILMGFIIEDTGMWSETLGIERPIPDGDFGTFF